MDLNKGTAILSSEFRPYKVNEAQIRKALETLSQYQTITRSVLALHDMLIEVHIKKNLDQRGGKRLYGAIDQFPLDVIQKLIFTAGAFCSYLHSYVKELEREDY